jgi:hypothetical protein
MLREPDGCSMRLCDRTIGHYELPEGLSECFHGRMSIGASVVMFEYLVLSLRSKGARPDLASAIFARNSARELEFEEKLRIFHLLRFKMHLL